MHLRALRTERDITQAEAARLAALPKETLCRIETGKATPTVTTLARLASAMDLSDEEIAQVVRSYGRSYGQK